MPPPTTSPALSIDGGERQQPSRLGERRQVSQRGDELFATERGEIPGFAELRVGEGGQDRVDVVERREAEDDVAGAKSLGRHREAQRRLRDSRWPAHAGFSQTETCFVLSLVNGSRFQPLQRSRSFMPASRAIRSSSAGHT